MGLKQTEPRSVSIGDNTFYIRPLAAFKAANLSGELLSLAAPLLTGLAPLLGSVELNKGEDGKYEAETKEKIPDISSAFNAISGDKVELILRHLLLSGNNISVEVNGGKVQRLTEDLINELFCADVQDMYILAYEVIKTNYSGFFKKAKARFGPLVEALTKKTSQTDTES